MADARSLPILGFGAKPLDNLFWPAEKPVNVLAILLPGLNYSMDMPLMFFTRQLLLWRGVDVLNLNPATLSPAFQTSSRGDQLAWLQADVQAGLNAGLIQAEYRKLILVGKSIGSLAIAGVVDYAQSRLPTALVWLTPLLQHDIVLNAALRATGPQAHLCGGADPTAIPNRLQKILDEKATASAYVVENGSHILDVPGNDQATFDGLREAMLFLGKFLDSALAMPSQGLR